MTHPTVEQRVEYLEGRVTIVEQILPTLATKADMADLKTELKADMADLKTELKADMADLKTEFKADIANLKTEFKADLAELKAATRADLDAAIAPLATKAEVKADGETTRRHFDVVAEGLRSDVALLATAVSTFTSTLDRSIAENRSQHATFIAALDNHEVRLTALERPRETTDDTGPTA